MARATHATLRPFPSERRDPVGSFEKAYVVGGQEFELYGEGEPRTFTLVTKSGAVVAEGLDEVPDEEKVAELINTGESEAA